MGHRTFSEAVGSSTYYPHAAISCLVSLILYKFVSPRVSRKIWKNYDLSPESVRVNWDTRFVSMVHSLVVSLMSSYAQLFDDDMHANLIWWDCAVARAACAIVVGYLSFDFILITVHYKHMGEVGFYFHHSASIYAYYFAVTYAMMPFFANFRLLAELSTPFLNVRWFLLTMGVSKSSPAFIINGLLFLVSFFLCRIVAIPFYWYKVYLASHLDEFTHLSYIPVILVITCVVLDSLNIYWFHTIVRGFLKTLKSLLSSGGRGSVDSSKRDERRESQKVKSG